VKTKAAVCYQPHAPLVVEELDIDAPKEGEVLVRIASAGVCHSDEHIMSLPAEPEIPIPTPVYLAATPEQRALIRKEALYVTAHVNGIYDRALKLQTGLTAENLPQRTEEVEAIEMERRQTALDVRDRLLEALPPVVQNALREFVETVIRKGYTIQILKSKLAQFQLPK